MTSKEIQDLRNDIIRIKFYTQYRTQHELEMIIEDGYRKAGYSRVMTIVIGILDTTIAHLCVETGGESVFARVGVRASRCEKTESITSATLAEYLYQVHQTAVPEIYGKVYLLIQGLEHAQIDF